MSVEAILTLAAIIVGPLLAVLATRLLDIRREEKARRLQVFRTLMATRAATLAPAHVEALNSIAIEFPAKERAYKKVVAAWRAYMSHLNDRSMPVEQWVVKRSDLLVELLFEVSQTLGYHFDKTDIKDGVYAPEAHGFEEQLDRSIRQGISDTLSGNRPLRVQVTTTPDTAVNLESSLSSAILGPPKAHDET